MADTDDNRAPMADDQRSDPATDGGSLEYVDRGDPVDEDESNSGGLGGIDAGSPGGMGGARSVGGTSNGNPPGGISPVQIEQATRGDVSGEDA